VFEEVGQFPYPRAVVGEDCPFFWFGLCFASFGFLWCVFFVAFEILVLL
jgi:hypothetical protein